jgi:hypothetical protein
VDRFTAAAFFPSTGRLPAVDFRRFRELTGTFTVTDVSGFEPLGALEGGARYGRAGAIRNVRSFAKDFRDRTF